MSWNYRIFEETYHGESTLSIREVYYDENGELSAYTQNPVGITWDPQEGETMEGQLALMKKAASKPIIRERDFYK